MKSKSIKEKIKEYFFINPTIKLRVRQIEREVKVPLHSAIRYTKELENEGILKMEDIANIRIYAGDRISKDFLYEKRLFNIQKLYISGLIEFLTEELSNPTIVVFGSYARGEDTEESDIDLYIETATKKSVNGGKFETVLKRNIQLFQYKNIHAVENRELANNIINGIVLNGFMEVITRTEKAMERMP